MLSPLQLQVAEIVGGLDEAVDFALAGGAALILRGDVQRQTRDLDFFGLTAESVDNLLPAVERALAAAGLSVRRIQVGAGFARLAIESPADRTEVDLAADARLFPAESARPAALLSREEIAVDKVLAIFGRAEARDFADLMALEERFGLARLFELSAEKDRGFTPALFAAMLARFNRLGRDEFDLDDAGYDTLEHAVRRWAVAAGDLDPPREH